MTEPASAGEDQGVAPVGVASFDPVTIWRLAIPVVAQNFLAMIVGWSDAIIAGQILVDERFLAAAIVASYLLWLLESCSTLIYSGSLAIVARLIGERDHREADNITGQSLTLAAGLGVGAGAFTWLLADPAAGLMGLAGETRALAATYLEIIATSCPGMFVMLVGTTCLRAAGQTVAGLWILIVVNVVNVIVSWLLTVGVGPMSALGWPGIAIGTATSFWIGGALTVVWLARRWSGLGLPPSMTPSMAAYRRILRIGVPSAVNSLAVVFAHLWFMRIISNLGTTATAAHGVAIRCESLSWLTSEAFAVAGATLVGQSLGARREDLARRYGWWTTGIAIAATSLMGVVFVSSAPILFSIIVRGDAQAVRAAGIPVLRLVGFAMPALAASVVLTGVLRGAGETRGPLIFNTVGLLGVRIPLAYLLTGWAMDLGLLGAWLAMFVDLWFRGFAAVAFFHAGRWARVVV